MSDVFEDALAAIQLEENTEAEVNSIYEKAKGQWTEIDKRFKKLRGKQFSSEGMQQIMAMVRKYAPIALRTMGYGGAGTALGEFLTDEGGGGIFSKLFGLFGG
jgi:hypothetical protein